MIDLTCLFVIVLNYVSDGILFVQFARYHRSHTEGGFQSFLQLDPERIQEQFSRREDHRAIEVTAGLLNAISWLLLCLPILKVVWFQSKQGTSKKNLSVHLAIAIFSIAGSLTEFIALVMHVGMTNAASWLAKSFNLSDWTADGSDDLGWRALEVCYIVTQGLLVWINAVEWFFLAGIMFMLFISIRSSDDSVFSRNWARLGVAVGLFCFADFASDLLRLESWREFMVIAQLLSMLNRLVLLPIWLVWLGRALATASKEDKSSSSAESDLQLT